MLFAEAIRSALQARGFEVVAIAGTGEEALRATRELRPDVVCLDIGLPDRNGLDVGREILGEDPTVKVLALTALEEPRAVREALRAGFHGYLVKDTPVARFVQAVEAAMGGQVVVPRRLASRVAGARSSEEEAAALLADQLTPREREVLGLLVEGASGPAIARRLGISPNTVRTHVQSILTKLQARSRLEAASFAVRHRITTGLRRSRPDVGDL